MGTFRLHLGFAGLLALLFTAACSTTPPGETTMDGPLEKPSRSWGDERFVHGPSSSCGGVVTDAAGNVIISCSWTDPLMHTYDERWVARYDVDQGQWSEPTVLASSPEQNVETSPTIAKLGIDDAGVATLIWLQGDGGNAALWRRRFDPLTTSWSARESLYDSATGSAVDLRLAVAASGSMTVAWLQYATPGIESARVMVRHYNALTSTWQPAQLLQLHLNRQIGLFGLTTVGEDAVASWWQQNGVRRDVWTSRYTAALGSWSPPMRVDPRLPPWASLDDANPVHLAMGTSGDAVLLWRNVAFERGNAAAPLFWAQRYDRETGGWGKATAIDEADPSIQGLGRLRIARSVVDAAGNIVVLWSRGDAAQELWTNHYDTQRARWELAQRLASCDQITALQAAGSAGGDVMVAWTQRASPEAAQQIWLQRFSGAAKRWDAPQILGGPGALGPSVVLDSAGRATALWTLDGAIWAQRYE